MHRLRLTSLVAAVPLLAALIVASVPARAATSGGGCGPSWHIVPSPNVSLHDEGLVATAAGSATDAWGVGWYGVGGSVFRSLTMHWDGFAWTAVSAPPVGAVEDTLEAVTSGAQGTWAVGHPHADDIGRHARKGTGPT